MSPAMSWRPRLCTAVVIASCYLVCISLAAHSRVKRQASSAPAQPRIVTQDGNLVFQTAANHNITFRSSDGGRVNIDGMDIKNIAEQVSSHKTKLQSLDGIQDQVNGYKTELDTLRTNTDNQLSTMSSQLTNTTRQINRIESQVNNTQTIDGINNRVRRLQRDMTTMSTNLVFDNCASGPCLNGGTCIDMYNTYKCFCPVNWQGTICNEDVNECAIYAGTAQGCHSGATCRNTNGGFSCDCPTDFTGVLCNVKAGKCSEGSNSQLCGFGTCIDWAGPTHTCLCQDGWQHDTATPPRCTVDINECEQVDKPCHDSVQCINVNGAYFCGACPAGYTGNGHQCSDINECETNNGGCSTNPSVKCINTPGSRSCGQCPAGYEKVTGELCIWVGQCHSNNGGCSTQAVCNDNPAMPIRSCTCKPGYTGSGDRPNGCREIVGPTPSSDNCVPNPCANGGNCFNPANTNLFTCACLQGWTGAQCQDDVNECDESPCQNGGTCVNTNGNYTCNCTEFSKGRNCDELTYQCGGVLTGETGELRFPPAQHSRYPHGISCAWRIVTSLNKVIDLDFTMFNIEIHRSCDHDFLQIHDGRTVSSQQIGKYCGNLTNSGVDNITSTHNLLYLWFKTDRSENGRGFALTWTSQTPVCGGDIRDETSGTVLSPGWPGNYPNNRTCVWTIRAPAGSNIHVHFAGIDLEAHADCSLGYLEFRTGLRETDSLIQRYCNTTAPDNVIVEGNELYIKFRSDIDLQHNGFMITWSTVKAAPQCGGSLNSTDGILTSPNYPNPYNQNGDCVWVISIPVNEQITLNFTDFAMGASSTDCAFDYIEVHDGSDDTSPQFGKFCGTSIPAIITSTGPNLYLRLHSDSSVINKGFTAVWTVACGGLFTQPTGEITSPYWPNEYPHSKTCNYLLTAAENQNIEVTFTQFSIQSHTSCLSDGLSAYNGSNSEAPLMRPKMCNDQIPPPLISTSNSMLLVFTTDGSVSDLGFQATYEFWNKTTPEDPTVCGGILTDINGIIRSPGFPNIYPHGVECLWEIRVEAGLQIRLSFDSFSIEQDEDTNCKYDSVQVSENRTSLNNTRFCGSQTPSVFTTSDNVLYMKFESDISVSHEGFSAHYITFNHSNWCGDEIRTLPGEITSPNFPADYPHQRQCIWTIVAPVNHQIALNFTNFDMENHTQCNFDFLEVRNGGNELSPLVGKFCGTEVDSPIFSYSNMMWIKFKSDVSDSAPGFRVWYEDAGEGCGAELSGPTGRFLSPNYPDAYNREAECYWTITVSQGSSIMLVFLDLDIEAHSRCTYDYVEVIEGLHSGRSMSKICGNTPPHPITTSGNQMTVKFRADAFIAGRGFSAAFFADCQNQVMNGSSGVIESPNFPDPYPHKRNCSWVINAGRGNVISLAFSHFDIENDTDANSCRYDFLEIRDGPRLTDNLVGRFCGSDLPPHINSTGSQLYLAFRSDTGLAQNGFRLEYQTIGCGRDFNAEKGTFNSPGYPGEYPHNRECIWRITVPIGKRIQLNLSNLDVEYHPNCTSDYIEVLGGPDANSPQLTKICQNRHQSSSVTSTGNHMYVKFRTDGQTMGTGFTANFSTLDQGCGATFNTPNGDIQSPGYPIRYPHNADCEWNITVAEFHTVKITFKEFDIEDQDLCTNDSVAINDGLLATSPELDRICGSNLTNHTYTSSSNTLRLRMKTDNSSRGRGFAASYETECGGRKIVGDGVDMIRSPHYPLNYDPFSNCTWTLMGASPVDRITLQFNDIDIEESEGLCTQDSIRVLQGDNADAPEYGRYCGNSIPPAITSTGYALTLIFTSNRYVQKGGFTASYSKSTSFCGGNFTAEHGAFSTPSHPDPYPRDAECIWYLNAAPGNQIQLSFTEFDIEYTEGCDKDYVDIRDGRDPSVSLGRYCGQTVPTNISVAQSMYVKFRSDMTNQLSGFTAQFSALTGGDMFGNTGQLASPLYPENYPHNVQHTWSIIVDQGKKVAIQFVDFDIETGSTCQSDYLKFLDGPADSGPRELIKICGTDQPEPLTSTGNVMTVVFHTDGVSTGRGFLFNWTAVDQTTLGPAECQFNLVATDTAQNLTSPNWPKNYENNMECIWTIRSQGGERIALSILTLDIEASETCLYDSLNIYPGESGLEFLASRLLDQSQGDSRLLDTKCGRITTEQPPIIINGDSIWLKFTSDVGVTRQGFQLQFKTTCGGTLTETQGVILSPNNPNVYPVNSSCQWLIQVTEGRTIDLTVESFSLPNSYNCTGDRLRILNGDNKDSPSIEANWAYCGDNLTTNRTFSSASNSMWVEFISDPSQDTIGNFKLSYAEESIVCGGNLIVLDDDNFIGSFSSPGYREENYPHNIECVWIITAPPNTRIQLNFPVFDLESGFTENCFWDYLEIQDGGSENSPELAKICGSKRISSVKSTSNTMRLRLTTDGKTSKGGFLITYKKDACGGTLVGASGQIQSPLYPNNYPNDSNCEWFIQGPLGSFLQMNFTQFKLSNISKPENCTDQDSLSIYNRNSFGNITEMIGSYCGGSAPTDIRTVDSRAYINFRANSGDSYPGFSLNFYASEQSCGGELTMPTGTIQSPGYPGYDRHGRVCTWRLTVPYGKRITLTFNDLFFEANNNFGTEFGFCFYDSLTVINGHLDNSPTIGQYCGNETVQTLESSGNKMQIRFRGDGRNAGFKITYTSDKDAVCGGLIKPSSGEVGHILTPGYQETISPATGNINLTGHYPNLTQCEWWIEGDSALNHSIILKFEPQRFKLEHDGECNNDFLSIREGITSSGRDVGRFCGNFTNSVPKVVSVPGDQMWLAFASGKSETSHEGFNITYQFAPCGGVLESNRGVITSPNYPSNYDHDIGCAWEIIAEDGAQIEITVDEFSLERSTNCKYDYLAIFNGGSHSSPRIATLCQGDLAERQFISATNRLRLEFVSDYSTSDKGFSLSYKVRQQGCGGIFTDLTGNISSQNYPANYTNRIECYWDIILPPGYTVILQNNGTFDIESGSAGGTGCGYDSIEFFNVDKNGVQTSLGDRYCGQTPPPTQTSLGNHMRVKFKSDPWINGTGFNMKWTAGCGGTFDVDNGIIFSPGYPNNYQHDMICDYYISASPDQFITLQFGDSDFKLEAHECRFDSVSIFEGSENGTSKGKFCGLTAPEAVTTHGPMLVRFETDFVGSDDGWKATIVRSDCGGYLNGSSGLLKSPAHPVDYHHNMNCTWLIKVSDNQTVKLRFEDFDVESSAIGNCQYDYLAVYDGPTIDSASLIGRYCGDVLPDNAKSTSNTMVVQFKTNAMVAKSGFRAVYQEAYGPALGCGGKFSSTSGTITPVLDSKKMYLPNLDCVWVVTVPDNKVIGINLTQVDMEAGLSSGSGCNYDGLELRDGMTSQDQKLTSNICGNTTDKYFTSSSNMLRVRFYSDPTRPGAGFNLTYSAVDPLCGGVREASEKSTGILQSPNYPLSPSGTPVNCRWVIGAPVGKQVRLTVTNMVITGDCKDNYLQFRDQPFITQGSNGQITHCGNKLPYSYDSSGRDVQVNFKYGEPASDFTGFRLQYSVADCSRWFNHTDGRNTSPGWPTSYPNGVDCYMNISLPASSGNKIALYFNAINIETSVNCEHDYLEIFDGSHAIEGSRLVKHCGSNIPDPLLSSGTDMVLHFVADSDDEIKGFDITYIASPSGCGGNMTSLSGGFASPTFRDPATCEWVIKLPTMLRPTLSFSVMDLRQNSTACLTSYVEVRNGGTASAHLMGRFCNNDVPQLTGKSNQLYIKFVTTQTLESEAKFKASYTSDEHRLHTA